MKIYVASSWRNKRQPEVVKALIQRGHFVYDFRNPYHREAGFQWADMDKNWEKWNAAQFKRALLTSPVASHAYLSDLRAMEWADCLVMVTPCGNSAHLELGWAAGRGKRTVVLLPEEGAECRPDLMLLAADHLCLTIEEVGTALSQYGDEERLFQETKVEGGLFT